MKDNIKITRIISISIVVIFLLIGGCKVMSKDSDEIIILDMENDRISDYLNHVGRLKEMTFEKELRLKLIEKGESSNGNLTY